MYDTEGSPSEIQQHVPDGPADGALSFVVHVGLRQILDEADNQFDVSYVVEKVKTVHGSVANSSHDGQNDYNNERTSDKGPAEP